MSCRTCGRETYGGQRFCSNCLNDWSEMRKMIWDYHTSKYGKISPDNLKIRQSETRRLDKLWRRDKDAFLLEVANETP